MKYISFRISDKEHDLYDKKVKEKLGVSLPVFFKSVGVSFLSRDEDIKKTLYNNNINLDALSEYYDTELKTYLTKEQYEALKKNGGQTRLVTFKRNPVQVAKYIK